MTPDWLNETVSGFGRQMGLSSFALNENGVAGVRFENGVSLKLEYVSEALMLILGVPMAADAEALETLLAQAHPLQPAYPRRVRVAYAAVPGEALLVMRVPEREVGVSSLEEAFGKLWERAQRLRRAAS